MKAQTDFAPRHWRSVGFRLAFYYGFLVTITMIATVSIIYMQTVGVLYQGVVRQVTAVNQKLTARFTSGGAQAVTRDISLALSDDLNSTTEIFLYLDPQGLRLAGNLDAFPAHMDGLPSGDRERVMRAGKQAWAYVTVQRLPDGSQLLVGSDLRDQEGIESLVTRGIAMASLVAVVFLIGGLFVFRQELDRSVEAIRRTLTRVSNGEIKDRVDALGHDDEFAQLGHEINKMLDHVEVLMQGVRHVSDIIAHNLRTPLTRILFRLRTVADEVSISADNKGSIEDAIRDIEELISVFEKLLRIAETEAGARRTSLQPVDLSYVVSEVIDFYEALADLQAAKIVCDTPGRQLVIGDPDLLAGAIANLIENALKYGGIGTTVTVQTETTGDRVILTVKDDGPGIPVQEMAQLGTRFFRRDRTISGHGLGLASVSAVVALHYGRLWFDNATPGLLVGVAFPCARKS